MRRIRTYEIRVVPAGTLRAAAWSICYTWGGALSVYRAQKERYPEATVYLSDLDEDRVIYAHNRFAPHPWESMSDRDIDRRNAEEERG